MARRSVLLLVAALIALVGTSMIVLYVQGIDARATEGQELVEVLTATDVIEIGDDVSAAQEAGKFEKTEVRKIDLVEGALSSTSSISDLVALGTIYPGEQIIARKFGSLGDADTLVIPDNKIAISVELTDPERVAGFVNPGSEVAIFISADPVRILPDGKELKLAPYTRLLLPKVEVVGVGTTSIAARTTKTEDGEEEVEQVARTILTVAVDQKEAERLIYAARNGDVSFAMLTSESKVVDKPGVTAVDVMPEPFRNAL
ncbi:MULTISPECIES: Flp pilus assembly protein CpaB [Nocardioides]|uniref:Flp pilus assembly protein CpaB n=1 Tax=Nocardioides TaxID=1839 RepID=UPI00032E64B8|nr:MULTISPECIES: RcpC/CpaB family pilus assembly protein [Nocardioides]EON23340.1 SAF domain-containing protein [Nocardioides sp. CF8]